MSYPSWMLCSTQIHGEIIHQSMSGLRPITRRASCETCRIRVQCVHRPTADSSTFNMLAASLKSSLHFALRNKILQGTSRETGSGSQSMDLIGLDEKCCESSTAWGKARCLEHFTLCTETFEVPSYGFGMTNFIRMTTYVLSLDTPQRSVRYNDATFQVGNLHLSHSHGIAAESRPPGSKDRNGPKSPELIIVTSTFFRLQR